MALDQSVLSELLDAFRTGEGLDLIKEAAALVCQELIEVELTAQIGADRYERTSSPEQRAQRAPAPGALDQGRRRGAGHPEAPEGELLPLDPRAPPADRPGPLCRGHGGLRARGVHPGRRRAGGGPRGQLGHLPVRGVPDLCRAGRGGRLASGSGGWTTWPSPTCTWTPPTSTSGSTTR